MNKEKVEKWSLISISVLSMVTGYLFLTSPKQMLQHIGQVMFLIGIILLLWQKRN